MDHLLEGEVIITMTLSDRALASIRTLAETYKTRSLC